MSILKRVCSALLATAAAASFAVGASGYKPSEDAAPMFSISAEAAGARAVNISKCTATLAKTELIYNGKAQTPAVTVKYGSKKLTLNKDYTLSYSNNKKIGTATVKVKGKGNYTGTKKLTFIIRPKSVKGLSAKSTDGTVTLSWERVYTCTGYKIYRLNTATGKYEGVKGITSRNTLSWTNKNLKPNTTYTYRVKPYMDVNGKLYCGKSVQISIKTKKATTPVAANGALRVSGANIVNSSGKKFQIRGMSTHGIMWEDYSDILSTASLKTLRDDWGVNTIRIAMYTEEWGGYTTGSSYASQAKAKVNTGVKNATDLGMYAIIDWHILNDGNPQKHQNEAVAFFTEMAKKYKNNNNVIYEICNEPNGNVTWNSNIKPYAEKVIKAIRKYDSDAIIIVGTGTWSQDIDKVVNNRLSDKNTVYALHFYANTHTDWLRTRFSNCYAKGLPILVSEFGTCDASGNGGYNATQTKKWFTLLDSKNVGYVNWSAGSKNETASAFKPGTNLKAIKSGTSQLTESGKLVRSHYRSRAGK